MQAEYDYLFKLLLIGNSEVGKSSILFRFADDVFSQDFLPTIGVDFKIRTINHKEKTIKLQCWDTAGQERYKTITKSYYKGAHGLLIVFNITDRQSFVDVSNWIEESKKSTAEGVSLILVGNKSDLQDKREVSSEEATAFAHQHNMKYIETSSKASTNIEQAFVEIVDEILNKQIQAAA